MKYLLSEKEYNELINRNKEKNIATELIIQNLCMRVAKYEPVDCWRNQPDGTPIPWGCVLDDSMEYCDECPVQDVCPNKFKRWSK
jgi:hypothetical protein